MRRCSRFAKRGTLFSASASVGRFRQRDRPSKSARLGSLTKAIRLLAAPSLALLLALSLAQDAKARPSGAVKQDDLAGWETLRGKSLVVRYRDRSDLIRARSALEALDDIAPLPGLRRRLRDYVVIIAPDREELSRLANGRVPEWAAAVALPEAKRIIVPSSSVRPRSLWEERRILRHEYAHLALHHEAPSVRFPRWFDEGYAEWAAGGWLDDGGWRLGVAALAGRLPALDSLRLQWPGPATDPETAYLLAASVLQYLSEASGEGALETLFEEAGRGGSFDDALYSVYGARIDQLESDWKKWARRRYGWLFALSHSVVFWLLLGCALLGMAIVRKRARREALARLRAKEPPEGNPYWEEFAADQGSKGR